MTGSTSDARPGAGATGRRAALLYSISSAAALAVTTGAIVGVISGAAVPPSRFALAVGATAAAQLARLTLRIGSDTILLAWGEVGVIVALCLLPWPWVPAAAGLGAIGGHLLRAVGADPAERIRILYSITVLTTGSSVATAVAAMMVGPSAPLRAELVRPTSVVPLCLAALSYFGTTTVLTSAWVASTTRNRFGVVWRRAARTKAVMLGGNIAVGLAVAVVIGVDVRWLAALAPLFWLLHQAYSHQMQASQERRTWTALADATRNLNQLDEQGVAVAAVRGAARLFAPDRVEVVVLRPSGRRRGYLGRTSDLVASSSESIGVTTIDEPADVPEAAANAGSRQVLVRRLFVGEAHIGELRLRFRRQVSLAPREQHAFSAFADAVASALHDAATHRQLRVMTARSAYDAVHDTLTGLANRSTLLARGNAELRRLEPGSNVALLLFDVDGFRAVNDTLSHAAGDELLRVLARRLTDARIDGELLGRLGGDVYALVMTRIPDGVGGSALERAQSVMATLAQPARIAGVTLAVEASAGVVTDEADQCDLAELLRRADLALHRAKRSGAPIVQYEAADDGGTVDRLALLADLRDALAGTDQLRLLVQPVVGLSSGAPTGAEALVRWHHPRRGLLAPADFIGVVEHSELVSGFTLHVLDRALGIAAGWATQGVHVPISVNLFPRNLLDRDLPAAVAGRLRAYGVRPERLVVEITESVMVSDEHLSRIPSGGRTVVEEVVGALKGLGVQVCVDDFGTGSAPMTLLTRLPLDEVKIDRSFVATMVSSPEAAAIVRATVDLSHELGLRVVAEGVERADQRALLTGLGVTAAQGNHFYPPLRVEEATAVLQGLAHVASARSIPIVRAATSSI